MEREPIDSTQIKAVGYDPKKKILEVQFLNIENVVRYYGVPPSKFDALMAAESHGGFLSDKIKGKYRFRTIS